MIAGLISLAIAVTPVKGDAKPPAFADEIDLAKSMILSDPAQALAHARSAETLAGAQHVVDARLRLATAHWLQAEALIRLDRATEGLAMAQAARAIAEKDAPNSKLLGDVLMAEGFAQETEARPAEALNDYQRANQILSSIGDFRGQSKSLQNIAGIYDEAKDYARALGYYRQATDIYQADDALALSAFNGAGITNQHLDRYAEAETSFCKAYSIAAHLKSPMLQVMVLTNIAHALSLQNKFDAAQAEISLAQALRERNPTVEGLAPFLWGVQAEVDFRRHRSRSAVADMDQAFKGLDLKTTDAPFRDVHEFAYQIYTRSGNYRKALAHLEAFKRLDDASWKLAASTSAQLASAQFDFAKQNLQITQLKLSKVAERQKFADQRAVFGVWLTFAILVALVLAIVALLVALRGRSFAQQSNRKLAQVNASLERALTARTDFLARTSHEMRTPLNGISGIAQTLLNRPDLSADIRDSMRMLVTCSDAMTGLVEDVLDMASIERRSVYFNRAEHDLGELLVSVSARWRERARQAGLDLVVDGIESAPRLVFDHARVTQVLDNLLSNAVKFTPAGRISLSCAWEAVGTECAVTFSVVDTGVGVPPTMRELIFEPFQQADGGMQRQFSGTGLGLSISRELARMMGGELRYEDPPHAQGAAFVFSFTACVAAPVPLDLTPASPLARRRVLLLEANPFHAALLRVGLEAVCRSVAVVPSLEAFDPNVRQGDDFILVMSLLADDDAQARLAQARDRVGRALIVVLHETSRRLPPKGRVGAMADLWLEKPVQVPALIEALRNLRADDQIRSAGEIVASR